MVAEHPVVQDFQKYYYLSNYIFMANDGTDLLSRIVIPFLLLFTWWEGQFLNILFGPLWFFGLPAIAFIYTIDFWLFSGTLISLSSSTPVLRDFQRMVDVTTIGLWAPMAFLFGYNLTYTDALPILIMAQWAFLPLNSLFFGTWTLILFPFSAMATLFSVFFSWVMFI